MTCVIKIILNFCLFVSDPTIYYEISSYAKVNNQTVISLDSNINNPTLSKRKCNDILSAMVKSEKVGPENTERRVEICL